MSKFLLTQSYTHNVLQISHPQVPTSCFLTQVWNWYDSQVGVTEWSLTVSSSTKQQPSSHSVDDNKLTAKRYIRFYFLC